MADRRTFIEARSRMAKAADEFLQHRALRFELSGRAYFEWLITRAAPEVANEAAGDETAYDRAAEAVWTLLTRAVDRGEPVTAPAPLAASLIPAAVDGRRGISAADLREALRDLCPIWPFCKRKRT